MFQTKFVLKLKTHTHTHFQQLLFENSADYEVWENYVGRNRPQVTIWRMRIACWIPNATNTHTHTDCVILIVFPLQQLLHKCAVMLHYTCIACRICVLKMTRIIINSVLSHRMQNTLYSYCMFSVTVKLLALILRPVQATNLTTYSGYRT